MLALRALACALLAVTAAEEQSLRQPRAICSPGFITRSDGSCQKRSYSKFISFGGGNRSKPKRLCKLGYFTRPDGSCQIEDSSSHIDHGRKRSFPRWVCGPGRFAEPGGSCKDISYERHQDREKKPLHRKFCGPGKFTNPDGSCGENIFSHYTTSSGGGGSPFSTRLCGPGFHVRPDGSCVKKIFSNGVKFNDEGPPISGRVCGPGFRTRSDGSCKTLVPSNQGGIEEHRPSGRRLCRPGLRIRPDGSCGKSAFSNHVYVYETPRRKVVHKHPPVVLPEQKVHYNMVFIQVDDEHEKPDPIVLPPPKQQTLIYLLKKKPSVMSPPIIEFPTKLTKPEVFFVDYDESEDPQLPGGLVLSDALKGYKDRGHRNYKKPDHLTDFGKGFKNDPTFYHREIYEDDLDLDESLALGPK